MFRIVELIIGFASITDAKRLIGRRYSDPTVQSDIKHWPFKVTPGTGDKPMIGVNYKNEEKQFSSEEISSMVLVKMKEVAEAYLGVTIKVWPLFDFIYIKSSRVNSTACSYDQECICNIARKDTCI